MMDVLEADPTTEGRRSLLHATRPLCASLLIR